MAVLDGLQELFGEVFADVFFEGVLHKIVLTDDGAGGYTATPTDHNIFGLVESATESMKSEADYTETDVSLIILQHLVPVRLNSDDKVTIQGVNYTVKAPISEDPVKAAWVSRGSVING